VNVHDLRNLRYDSGAITRGRHAANVDDLRNLRYDSGAITRGRHARQLHYKIMSERMDLI